MTERDLREKICAQARSWLGRNEADGSHREIIDLYNAGRPAGSYRMSYEDPWCAAFVSAVGMACGLEGIILPHVNCDGMIAAYRAEGRWIEDDAYDPAPGDIIFYDWQDDGVGDNAGSSDHVGIVEAVNGDTILAIEGNKSDSVSRRVIFRDGRFIRGYAVPDYAAAADDVVDPEPDPEPAAELDGLPTIRFGDAGWTVCSAQGALIAHGFSCGPDGPDGDFGRNTRNAATRFQRSMGLDADGVIGPQTWAALLLGKEA